MKPFSTEQKSDSDDEPGDSLNPELGDLESRLLLMRPQRSGVGPSEMLYKAGWAAAMAQVASSQSLRQRRSRGQVFLGGMVSGAAVMLVTAGGWFTPLRDADAPIIANTNTTPAIVTPSHMGESLTSSESLFSDEMHWANLPMDTVDESALSIAARRQWQMTSAGSAPGSAIGTVESQLGVQSPSRTMESEWMDDVL